MKNSTDPVDRIAEEGKDRSWSRFGLRTIFLIVATLCVWLAVYAKRARIQQNAIDRVHELGGLHLYDFEVYDINKDDYVLKPFGPDWVYDLIGIDFAGSVLSLNLSRDDECNPTNDDLGVLNNFPDLRALTLDSCKQVNDDGLIHLAGLSRLEELSLAGTNVVNDGLRHITSLRKLRALNISDTPLFDSGLKHIGKLRNLEFLDLTNTRITNEGLKHLAGLTSLKHLFIPPTISEREVLELRVRLPQCKIEQQI